MAGRLRKFAASDNKKRRVTNSKTEGDLRDLYSKLKLESLEEWTTITRQQFINNGGRKMLRSYGGDFKLLLSDAYPNYPWDSSVISWKKRSKALEIKKFNTLEKQQTRMDEIFKNLKLTEMGQWMTVPRTQFNASGGKVLLYNYYQKKMPLLFQSIYPNYPWKFSTENSAIKTIQKQQNAIDNLYYKLQLSSLQQWLSVPRQLISQSPEGRKLLDYYRNNFFVLLSTLYPHYPWVKKKKHSIDVSIHSIEYQRERMEQSFAALQLSNLEEWLIVPLQIFQQFERKLLKFYRYHLPSLLSSVYPHYPWPFSDRVVNLKSKRDEQREAIDQLFFRFKFTNLDDWRLINHKLMKLYGGGDLLKSFQFDIKSLLSTLYPNYPWRFEKHSTEELMKQCITKYRITQKKDWYRLPLELEGRIDLISALKTAFPTEHWCKSNFQLKTKRSSQRLLFSLTHTVYPSSLIIENYLHPKLVYSDNQYELDLFIPSLQLALEYQGAQHYDDMPAFAGIDLFQSRDQQKERMANDLSIKIVYIPYWWDHSLSSLQSSLPILSHHL